MAGFLIALALLAAIAVLAARKLKQRAERRDQERALAEREGTSADRPVKIQSFSDIDDFLADCRCPCGGLLDRIGEGGRPGVRVVRCTCLTCERDVDLFFDLTELRH